MRALGRQLEERRATSVSRYDDIEANKARSQRGAEHAAAAAPSELPPRVASEAHEAPSR